MMQQSIYGNLTSAGQDPITAAIAASAAAQLTTGPGGEIFAAGKDTTFTKIFVGGLPYHTSDQTLKEYFEQFGDIDEAVVITDRQTGKSRGYGFVTMKERVAAERACKEPNPIIDGRKANVNLAYLGAKPRSNVALSDPFAGLQFHPLTLQTVVPQAQARQQTVGMPQLYYQTAQNNQLLAAAANQSLAQHGLVMPQQMSTQSHAAALQSQYAQQLEYAQAVQNAAAAYAAQHGVVTSAGYDPYAVSAAMQQSMGLLPTNYSQQNNVAATNAILAAQAAAAASIEQGQR